MPITTIKRVQTDGNWWWTLEDCNVEVTDEPKSGLTVTYHEKDKKNQILTLSQEEAVLFRDALMELYPLDKFPKSN